MIVYQVTADPKYQGAWMFNFLSYKDAVEFADNDTYPEHKFVIEYELELTDGEVVYTAGEVSE